MIACLRRHDDVICMLLNRFKPDLEVPNNIFLDEIHPTTQIYLDVSVLWAAAATGNFPIVKLLLEHGANVNYRTKTKSTPLRCTCRHGNMEMVRYLIENGADVHAKNERNETNLMVSANYNHLDVVAYLIEEFNCDINAYDDDGRSALYDAVYCQSLEIVEFLLKRGACNFRAKIDQMSPLMWAAEKRQISLVDAISPYCPLLEQIEAKELLGSAFVCALDSEYDPQRAFQYFHQALTLRLTHNLPKVLRITTTEIFDNRQECQIPEELEENRYSLNYMYTEALLIRERLLGSADKRYRATLAYRGAILADNREYHRALMLWMYELDLRQQYSIAFEAVQICEIVSLMSETLFESIPTPIDPFLTLLALISEELERNKKEFDRNLFTLLFLITVITEFLGKFVIDDSDRATFYHQLYTINRRRYATSDNRQSLLHLSLDHQTSTDDYHIQNICKYPCLQTTRILLQCGADVNAIDVIRNTPLHVFVSNNEFICDDSILQLLCDAGAHLDYVNVLGETPFDLAKDPMIKHALKIRMHQSLKCLCARFIQKNKIPFQGKVYTLLVHFVEKH